LIHIDFTAQKFMALRFENEDSCVSLSPQPDYLPVKQLFPETLRLRARNDGVQAFDFFS
jgi:hypothetical protein